MAVWLMVVGLAIVGVAGAAEGGGERGGRSSGSTVLADIAQELIARSGTSSQVLSLNLTNLVIMLVLKGLLVAAAMWGAKGGAGHGAGEGWQRSRSGESPLPALPSATFLSESELALLVSYLMGESDGSAGSGSSSDSCLLRVACEEPKKAREYIAAGRMAIKAAKILDKVVPVNPKYARLLDEMAAAAQQGAADDGRLEACRRSYKCGHGRHDHNHNGV